MNSIVKFVIVLLVLVAAVLGSLVVFGAMTMDTFTDSVARMAGVGAIVVVATVVIGMVSGSKGN